nr:methyltransferase [Mucilaginibacter celer]
MSEHGFRSKYYPKRMFRFKQFNVDQTGCAMKINTDGVLLGAMVTANNPQNILDIGTGTGVIAMMLAQRFTSTNIDAVEIDEQAASTANANFQNSPFQSRLTLYPGSFEHFFDQHPQIKYDLIVSNPPFYINSLQSPTIKINLAKHAAEGFFEKLIASIVNRLTEHGLCWLILPVDTSELIKGIAKQHGLHLQKIINVHSFQKDNPHREIVVFGRNAEASVQIDQFNIYEDVNIYSAAYRQLLKPYFLAF